MRRECHCGLARLVAEFDVRVESDVDIADPDSWSALAARLACNDMELLGNNAGIGRVEAREGMTVPKVLTQFQSNAVGPPLLTYASVRMRPGAKVLLLSSRLGSIGDNGSAGHWVYRMSKAALNAAGVSLAHDPRESGIAVVILHPGVVWTVWTDMTGGLEVDPVKAAVWLLRRVDEFNIRTTGKFLHQNGSVVPW